MHPLTETMKASARCGIGEQSLATIINTYNSEIGENLEENPDIVLTSSGVHSKRKRALGAEADAPVNGTSALFMDGKRFNSLEHETYNGDDGVMKHRNVLKNMEHIIVGNAETGELVGEFTPESGSGKSVAEAFLSFLESKGLKAEDIKIIGGDSTASNTGNTNGCFALIDEISGMPRNHFICCLHLTELPLRHLAEFYLGRTKGPNSFNGPHGDAIRDLKNPKIAKFPPIAQPNFPVVPDEILQTLSQDQKLLYQACRACITGICPPELSQRCLGPLNFSRWLTLALRILMYYMTFETPPHEIQRLAIFILNHYAPQWFTFRVKWRATDAPAVLFEGFKVIDGLLPEEKAVVLPVLERAYFWRHPEQLILGCLASPESAVRATAADRVIAIRRAPNQIVIPTGLDSKTKRRLSKASAVRPIIPPKTNKDASHFSESILWDQSVLTGMEI